MTRCHWIVCERSNRWTAALRTALARDADHADLGDAEVELHEVRNLDELTGRLVELPHSFALIEVTPKNLDATLAWLAATTRQSVQVETVALLDRGFLNPKDVASAVREAGALEIAQSPRQLRHVLQFCQRWAAKRESDRGKQLTADRSIEDWAWSLLPWQDARRPVG